VPKIAYEHLNLSDKTLKTIALANDIIHTYAAQGYDLTLRQLYYQFVSRDLLPNKQTEYKRLGDIVSKGRRAGLIDWNAIVDRTRNLRSLGAWDSPSDIIAASASQFRYDWWAKQPVYVECWFEKDALMGVFERAANKYRVPFFSCRGYTSDSEVWSAAQRMASKARGGKSTVVLHFGDHDPSGIDMTRDIRDRLRLFGAGRVDVRRLALNQDQIDLYNPPPNPAKESDSRFVEYQALHGDESWELDALEPTVLGALVRDEVATLVEQSIWDAERLREAQARAELQEISDNYDDIAAAYPPRTVTVDDLDEDEEDDDG
jgi:hypothetical protein